ncbi:MAG: glycosyltransferase family 4 protein, partial [Candidatus Lokiarchaeota archaeon]
MNILILTSSFPRFKGDVWGPWILDYSQELSNEGENVIVLAPHSIKTKKYSKIDSVVVHRFSYWLPKRQILAKPPGIMENLKIYKNAKFQIIPYLFFNLLQGLKMIKKYQIDIIFCQWVIPSGFIGLFLGKIFNKPVAVSAQGAEFYISKNSIFGIIISYVIRKIDLLLPVSNNMMSLALNYSKNIKCLKVLPNAVDTNKFKPLKGVKLNLNGINPKYKKILTVRRLVVEKKVDLLIKSFKKLLEYDPNIHLIIGGDGPEKRNLIELTKKLGISKKVKFLGFISHDKLNYLYNLADIYVLTSEQEGLSLSLLEALATKIPVVSTNIVGNPEVIIHKKTGLLFKPGDIDQLTYNIRFLLDNPDKAKDIGRNAREFIIN